MKFNSPKKYYAFLWYQNSMKNILFSKLFYRKKLNNFFSNNSKWNSSTFTAISLDILIMFCWVFSSLAESAFFQWLSLSIMLWDILCFHKSTLTENLNFNLAKIYENELSNLHENLLSSLKRLCLKRIRVCFHVMKNFFGCHDCRMLILLRL